MSDGEERPKDEAKDSIVKYVGKIIEKLQTDDTSPALDNPSGAAPIDRPSIIIQNGSDGYDADSLLTRRSVSTEFDADEFNLDSDPVVETKESDEKVYRQQVFVRQYQPPTPEPLDIHVQEVPIATHAERSPIHVHVGPIPNRTSQRTPSPILIKSLPPEPVATNLSATSGEPIVFKKYVPANSEKPKQQIIIHRYPEPPPKPRPIVVEQWLPSKPAPKRVIYRQAERVETNGNEDRQVRNRLIQYQKPHTTIQLEVIRLPVIKISPEEYQKRSSELTKIDQVRSIKQDPNTLNWRI